MPDNPFGHAEKLTERESQQLIARLDEVYADVNSSIAPELAHAQSKAIGREEW